MAQIKTKFIENLAVTDAKINDVDGSKLAAASVSDGKLASTFVKANGTVPFTADQSMGGFKLTNLGTPTASGDAATKSYVDSAVTGGGSYPKILEKVATVSSGNITLSGLQTIAGVTLVANDRVLVRGQTTASQNGIYLAASGAWTRATDFDVTGEMKAGTQVIVDNGSDYASAIFALVEDVATVGTDLVSFVLVNPQVLSTTITLGAGDITNQYVQINAGWNASILGFFAGGLMQIETDSWTLDQTQGDNFFRVAFDGDLATGGAAELVSGDKVVVQYKQI